MTRSADGVGWRSPLRGLCGRAAASRRRLPQGLTDPAPIVRARSVGLGDDLPEGQVVPALIDRLDDPDPVVRLAAYEELQQGHGPDFGFVPWAGEADRRRRRGPLAGLVESAGQADSGQDSQDGSLKCRRPRSPTGRPHADRDSATGHGGPNA